MDRSAWRRRSEDHLRAARTLYEAGQFSVAYHLAGLAIESAIKARIAASFRAGTWPTQQFVNDIHSHDLSRLISLAGLSLDRQHESERDPAFRDAWELVRTWTIESRYAEWSEAEARDMLDAVGRRRSGVMAWIRRHW